MRRYHLIELHEQSWYPAAWRRIFQSGLGRALDLTGTLEGFSGPFQRFLAHCRATSILDLCSGSGEAARFVWKSVASTPGEGHQPKLVLSDLFPNHEAFEKLKAEYPGGIEYFPEPVNAMNPPAATPRVRTLFDSLHHFRPEEARAILNDAAENADGIAVFESTSRNWKHMAQTLFVLPFLAAFLVAFLLRPIRFENILWGLLVPVIPFTAVFDGLVSSLRSYSTQELEAMTHSLERPEFVWEIGTVPIERSGLEATYLLGWRKDLEPGA